MSYVSPIKIGYDAEPEEGWTDKIGRYMAGEVDNLVLQSCVKVGCHVDKDELEKALRYDRGQYEKGYEDGKRDAVVRCRECKWYSIYEAKKDGSPDKRYSPSVCLGEIYAKRRDPDWFCADGERREE